MIVHLALLFSLLITINFTYAMQDPQTITQPRLTTLSSKKLSPFCLTLANKLSLDSMIVRHKTGERTFCYWNHDPLIKIDFAKYDCRNAISPINSILALFLKLFNAVNAQNPIELNLSCNDLKAVPPRASKFKNLRALVFNHNKLSNSGSLVQLFKKCPHLQTIDLSNNKLTCLPREIKYLTALQSLNLFSNALSPQAIANICDWCQAIQKLNLSFNCIKKLPAHLRFLSKLLDLRLAYNSLEEATLWPLLTLTQLRILDLSGNSLYSLPQRLLSFHNLALLYLENNLFSGDTKAEIASTVKAASPNANVMFNCSQ